MLQWLKKKRAKDSSLSELSVLYGSQTGNAKYIAKELSQYLKVNNLNNSFNSMKRVRPEDLNRVKKVLIVVSTCGEGDPPDNAQKFLSLLQKTEGNLLANLQYSICALGDSDYDNFCETGRQIHQELSRLGAKSFISGVECDADYQETASGWIKQIGTALSGAKENPKQALKQDKLPKAKLISREQLNKDSLAPAVMHLEFETDQKISYQPGDLVSVLPRNNTNKVSALIDLLKLNAQEIVQINGDTYTLHDALTQKREIAQLNSKMVKAYGKISRDNKLELIVNSEQKLKSYVKENNLFNLLVEFPIQLSAQSITDLLPKLKPRKYTIASYQTENRFELTVRTATYFSNGKSQTGVCSTYLNEQINMGETVDIKLHSNEAISWPSESETPVIFIVNGTGIALFRSYMRWLETCNLRPKVWLIFGERYPTTDLLYQKEIERWQTNGLLSETDIVFSRAKGPKRYVQHTINEKGTEIESWYNNDKANIYVCGSFEMGNAVKVLLDKIIPSEGNNRLFMEVY